MCGILFILSNKMSIVYTTNWGTNLLLGSVEDAFDSRIQQDYNPIYVNVADELSEFNRISLTYNFNLRDDDINESVSKIFPDILILLHDLLSRNNVLVHCLEGKSRSVCIVLVYLVCYQCFKFDDAYNELLIKRPCIEIFPKYLTQVKDYLSNKR